MMINLKCLSGSVYENINSGVIFRTHTNRYKGENAISTSILGNKKKAAWNLYLFVKEPTEKTMYIWISKNCPVLLQQRIPTSQDGCEECLAKYFTNVGLSIRSEAVKAPCHKGREVQLFLLFLTSYFYYV